MKKGLLVVLALAASPAVAQQDFSKVEIEATKLSDSAWLLVGAGGNIGLSVGSDGVVMIDDRFARGSACRPTARPSSSRWTSKPRRPWRCR
ncbi:MAG TPA: hypothetical protein VGI18_14735 [Burkholderiales bacterium]|jgi:hypothetical protein